MIGSKGISRPMDLRDAGRPEDPLFARPLVYGRIDTGVVEVRRPGSDEVERHVVKLAAPAVKSAAASPVLTTTRKGHVVMVEAVQMKKDVRPDVAAVTAIEVTETASTGDRVAIVARLYREGATYRQMAEAIGVSDRSIHYYIQRAVEAGLIEKRRTPKQVEKPNKDNLDEVMRLIQEIKRRIDDIALQPAPSLALFENLSRELDEVKREHEILAGGLAELSNRLRAIEEKPVTGLVAGTEPDAQNRVFRLLELALASNLLAEVRRSELGGIAKNGVRRNNREKSGDRGLTDLGFQLETESPISAENGAKRESEVA